MMILRSLTPLIGLVTLTVADTSSSPKSTAKETCQRNDACNLQYDNSGRMVLSHLWRPNATTGASDSWDIGRFWHAKCDGSKRQEDCDARAYDSISAMVAYHYMDQEVLPFLRSYGPINGEQVEKLLKNTKTYLEKASADGTPISTNVTKILAEAGYKEMLDSDKVKWAESLLEEMTIEPLEKLKENLGASELVEPFLQEAWAKDGSCIGALSTSCYGNDGNWRGIVAYVDRLATLEEGKETYKRLADNNIVPSDSELYSLEDIKAAIRGNGAYTGATIVCSNDTLVEINYYWKVQGRFDQSVFTVADPQFEEPDNCPDQVRYPPKINLPGPSKPACVWKCVPHDEL